MAIKTAGYIFFLATMFTDFSIASAIGGGGGGGSAGGDGGGGTATAVETSPANISGGSSGTQDQLRTQDQIRDPATHDGTEPDRLQTRDQDRTRQSITSSVVMSTTSSVNATGEQERLREQEQVRINLQLSSTTAQNAVQLHQMIQERQHEMEQVIASSSTSTVSVQNLIQNQNQNQNQVRLAAYAFIAAQNLLGNAGPQMATIAGQIDDSSATIANAEKAINTRGAFERFFFGGDTASAATIQKEVTQNQERIAQMTQLLNQSSSTVEVKTTLQAQIRTMTNDQARLQELATREQKQWGLFSWRLF